jgi:DNA-binding transcriptional LysR family regulator
MELRQLEYLVAVAEEANFTRAAERVHISQSGVSAQIRQLERELGTDLFDRAGRTATLTPAGKAALGPARDALAAVETVRREVDAINDVVRGELAVGMVVACTVRPLFDALARFRTDHPGVGVSLVEAGSDRLVDDVRRGALDVALVATAGAPPSDLGALTVVTDRLVAAVPTGHRHDGRRRLTLADLLALPLVSLPPGTGVRTALERACDARGLSAEVALEASSPDAVIELARRGLGVAVLSESMVEGARGLHPVHIDHADIPAVLALVWRPGPGRAGGRTPAVDRFLAHARRAFRREAA